MLTSPVQLYLLNLASYFHKMRLGYMPKEAVLLALHQMTSEQIEDDFDSWMKWAEKTHPEDARKVKSMLKRRLEDL